MYAIVDIAGKQYKVEKDKFVYAPLLEGKEGSKVDFDQVLLIDDAGKITVGAPLLKGAKVSGKILEHVQGDKVIVFKKKRRKGYKKKNGHRQEFTKVQIEGILTDGKKSTSSESTKSESKTSTQKKEEKSELSQINGIGPVYEKDLNELGFYTLAEMAKLTKTNREHIAGKIDGIGDDLINDWVIQAKELTK